MERVDGGGWVNGWLFAVVGLLENCFGYRGVGFGQPRCQRLFEIVFGVMVGTQD